SEQSPLLSGPMEAMKNNGVRIWINSLWPRLNAGHDDERAVYEPDEAWGWLIDKGASIIQTDRPSELLAYLEARGLRNLHQLRTTNPQAPLRYTDATSLTLIGRAFPGNPFFHRLDTAKYPGLPPNVKKLLTHSA